MFEHITILYGTSYDMVDTILDSNQAYNDASYIASQPYYLKSQSENPNRRAYISEARAELPSRIS